MKQKMNIEEISNFLQESIIGQSKKVSDKNIINNSDKIFSPENTIKTLLSDLEEKCIKDLNNNTYHKFYSKETEGYEEGTLFKFKNGDVMFKWDLEGRGIYRTPNFGSWDLKDPWQRREAVGYYGFDDTIVIETVPSKYSRKDSFGSRRQIHGSYNVQLQGILWSKYNDCLNLRWVYGSRQDGLSKDDEMKIDFSKCSKSLKKRILDSFKKKMEQIY